MPDGAIIIPHFNDVDRLLRCLDALMPQVNDTVEVVVVDNASTEGLDLVHSNYPDIRLVTEPAKGAACARNRGVAETSAPILLFLDADCVPAADWIQQAIRAASLGDVVGGAIDVFDETPPPRSGAEAFETVFAFDNRAYIETQGFSVTANMVTRRDVFVATGPFDDTRSEDVDWCRRAVGLGYTLAYADNVRVAHPSRADWPSLRKKWRRTTHEGFGLNGADAPGRLRWAIRALLMPVSILAHAPKVMKHPDLRNSGERHAALATLARLRLQRMVWMLWQVVHGHRLGR